MRKSHLIDVFQRNGWLSCVYRVRRGNYYEEFGQFHYFANKSFVSRSIDWWNLKIRIFNGPQCVRVSLSILVQSLSLPHWILVLLWTEKPMYCAAVSRSNFSDNAFGFSSRSWHHAIDFCRLDWSTVIFPSREFHMIIDIANRRSLPKQFFTYSDSSGS